MDCAVESEPPFHARGVTAASSSNRLHISCAACPPPVLTWRGVDFFLFHFFESLDILLMPACAATPSFAAAVASDVVGCAFDGGRVEDLGEDLYPLLRFPGRCAVGTPAPIPFSDCRVPYFVYFASLKLHEKYHAILINGQLKYCFVPRACPARCMVLSINQS